MSWGLDFTADIYMSRVSDFDRNPYRVKEEIENINDEISDIEEMIKMYAASNMADVVIEEVDRIHYIHGEVTSLLTEFYELVCKKEKLKLYLETLEQ
jgi:hypothetical protein